MTAKQNLPLLQCSKIIAALLCFCIQPFFLFGQNTKEKPARILFLMDGSSSMTYKWSPNETRNKVGSRIVNAICDSILNVNKDVEFAVRTYGTQFPAQQKNCLDTKLEVPFTNYYNIQNLKTKVSQIQAYGYSPIAYSLQQAATHDFVYSDNYAYSIILITDGGESCGGDICAIMQELINKKISFKPYIISLVNDDLLAKQYDCMGNYLNVRDNNDIVTAIQRIIKDNRKILTVKKQDTVIVKANDINPITPKVDTPKIVKENPVFTFIQVQKVKSPVSLQKKIIKYKQFKLTNKAKNIKFKFTYTPLEEESVAAPMVYVQKIKSPNKLSIAKKNPYVIKLDKRRTLPKVKFINTQLEEEVTPIKFVQVDKVKSPIKMRKFTKIYVIPSDYKKRQIPKVQYKYVLLQEDNKPNNVNTNNTTKPIVTTKPNNTKPPADLPKDMQFNVKTEDADKTYLRVFIVNSRGKQYPSQPLMNLTNTKTKVTQKKYRAVSNGQPKPIEIEAGNYHLSFGSSDDYAKNIVIEPNKVNIVTITVNPSTISFYYETDPKRPVKEFRAYISNRFDPAVAVVTHPCDEKLYYDPANYHIEINTLPPTALNMDLEPGMGNNIALKETGTIQISNTNKLGRIEFWFRAGTSDRFFYAMNINGDGNLATQQQEFLPGVYEVRYYKPNASAMTIKKISIKSKEVTAVLLD